MESEDRIERATRLQASPGGSVPVAPLIITYTAKVAGVSQAELFSSVGAWREATDRAIDRLGASDMGFA